VFMLTPGGCVMRMPSRLDGANMSHARRTLYREK
jgi:hypothetical protein